MVCVGCSSQTYWCLVVWCLRNWSLNVSQYFIIFNLINRPKISTDHPTPSHPTPPRMETHILYALRWRHNDHDGVSNHQPHHCLLNCLFGRRSKKTSKLHVTGLCARNSPHKWPVTRKMFPFNDVIMVAIHLWYICTWSSACITYLYQRNVLIKVLIFKGFLKYINA